jgi:hypothetical protein
MTSGSGDLVHSVLSRVVAIAVLLLLVTRAVPAHADAVDTLIDQLGSGSQRVRLAAAVNLAKLGDPKAILPLVKALGNDEDKDVRGAAAFGLGKLVTSSTPASQRKLAINALKKAAANDASGLVKSQAQKALAALGADAGDAPPDTGRITGGGSIYVNIGPMSSKTGTSSVDSQMRPLMVKIATKTMGKAASSMATSWPGGGIPTKKQLDAKGFLGFYVDGTLNELEVKKSGNSATVSCKVSMLLASFPDKSVFGFLNGSARVQGSASDRDIALASEDCVAAVVEDLIAKKIVPTIKAKAGTP